ncbi:trypsin-like serine protease [Streptomyces sp. NPDC005648]|uniref:trypsin-like serine protease n=1 Tax=Streptomyces sp. NPDC005648 TaxID=3157044 RepID=UPI0033AE712D
MRFALPVAAAGVAAAVGAALMTFSASAATSVPTPSTKPATRSVSTAALTERIAGALATDGTAGTSAPKSTYSTSTAKTPYVIGGTDTAITSAPWMAQLWYYDDNGTSDDTSDDIGFFCGGTVVSPTKILTAAHCMKDEKGNTVSWSAHGAVLTGTSQLPTTDSSGNTDVHGGTVSLPLRQWNHPSFNLATVNNDIAVVTLASPIKATPLRMATSGGSYPGGTTATLYGWGRTSSGSDDISDTLKSASLTIHTDATCSSAWGSDYVAGHMICAGTQSGTDSGTKASCNGDSGGPLVVNNRIVGVVSWGVQDCVDKGYYSVFTKVSTYVGAAYANVDDTNLSYTDGKADLFVRSSSTKEAFEKDSKGTSFAARISLGSYSGVNLVLQTDLNRDGYQDLILRQSSGGDVYWMHYVPSSDSWSKTKIYSDWSTRTRIIAPGDVTGDYLPDLLSVDSGGTLWIYPGKGNGTFAARVKVGSGWNQYDMVRGKGDFSGDGKTDLLARNHSTGDLYLYKGTGTAGTGAFSARVKVRTGWKGYNAFDAVGDVNGDGKADFLARTSGGTLYLYKGTGKATSEIFATRVSVGTGFQQYDIFG